MGKNAMRMFIVSVILLSVAITFFSIGESTLASEQNERNEIIMDADIKVPPTKIPPISFNSDQLLRTLLERVWVTKYYGAPTEIYKVPDGLPLCETLPVSPPKQDSKSGVFLWNHKCLPLEIKWEKNKNDLSGIATLRMLNFNKADEVLEAAFEIIKTNTLGVYKIEESKKDTVKDFIIDLRNFHIENPENRDFKNIFSDYKDSLKTYPILEGYYFLEKALIGKPDVTSQPEEFRKYFAYRARKYALTIEYNSAEFLKKDNVIEYTLKAPVGFFGMEEDYKKGKSDE